jgi:hypothetical protein
MSDVHNRTRYLAGCRCDRCRKAQSDYRKDLRRRSKSKQPTGRALTSVPSPPKPPAPPPTECAHLGPVEAGVLAEIEGLTTAAKRPGLVEGALAMARLLDNQLDTAQHPQAMARLQAALDQLRKGADSRKSWLAEVRKLTPVDGRGDSGA